jgi:hypothetical protein
MRHYQTRDSFPLGTISAIIDSNADFTGYIVRIFVGPQYAECREFPAIAGEPAAAYANALAYAQSKESK